MSTSEKGIEKGRRMANRETIEERFGPMRHSALEKVPLEQFG
jgi:hypothetical protein